MNRKRKKLNFPGVVVGLLVSAFLFMRSLGAAPPTALPSDQFGSLLTLDEAVTKALEGDPEVKRALARLHKEESLYKGSRSEFFPKLNAGSFAAFATGDKHFVDFLETGIEQPIFQGGKAVAGRKKHETMVRAERMKLGQAKFDIEFAIRVLYARVLQEKELTRIAQNEVKELLTEHDRIKKLKEMEALPLYEFFRIETLLAAAKHTLVEHKETYDYLLTVLKETVGMTEGESIELEPLGETPRLSDHVSFYLDSSRQYDPLYKLKDLEIKEKQFEKRELQAERFPHLSLSAKWNRANDVFLDTNRLMVGVAGKWNIWDFGRLGSQINAKSNEIEETKWEGELEVRKHEQEIKKIFHEARAVREKIQSTDALIRERQEIYKNEKTKLIAGEKGASELVDSFAALEEAKIKQVEATSEYRLLLVTLGRKTGFKSFGENLTGHSGSEAAQ